MFGATNRKNITVISTRHADKGNCNSYELYNILEGIAPEVIFEEIPPSFFENYYIEESRSNLESIAIRKYVANKNIRQIMVDSDDVPSNSFFRDYERMNGRVEGLIDINGYNFRTYTDEYIMLLSVYGFNFLNSILCENIQAKIDEAVAGGLKVLNNEELFQLYNKMKEINQKREKLMLDNIYYYCKNNCFNKAVFTIGNGHRRSLKMKIEEYESSENIKINWLFYGD